MSGFGFRFALLLSVACCWLAGCGVKQGQLPLAKVTGQVTFRGAPLTAAVIKFYPVQSSGTGVRVAFAHLDHEGRYCLSTYGHDDGAILGDHRVTIECPPEMQTGSGNMVKHEVTFGAMPPQQSKAPISTRYANPDTSGLTAHVTSGSNSINFELKE
jgi:hypothetical protein